jgi:[acyl-carrier-protein] S-malonyltransferase
MARRIALLFPGQAAQQVGMGRLAAERFPQAREVFERVDATLGMPVSQICFEGPAARLQETQWQQPAIFACSMALYAAWRISLPADDQIVCAAGHSLGEYGALVAAGALSLEDGARLVAVRGQAMQRASDAEPSGMWVIIGLSRAAVEEICQETNDAEVGSRGLVVLANDNAPGQQVISGSLDALEAAAATARQRGARRVLPLKVAGAFHSPLMEPAVEDLRAAIDELHDDDTTRLHPCGIPVVANSTAGWLLDESSVREELVRQVTWPVRWVESVQAMAALEPDLWVDVGPGNVVAGMASRILQDVEPLTLSTLIDVPAR